VVLPSTSDPVDAGLPELLAEWVQPHAAEANAQHALEQAVQGHLAIMQHELRLNMGCFAPVGT
jgi:hypothetical protein